MKELPYCCEVRIDEFKEPKPNDKKKINRLKATIFVERESQKLIVIGKGGVQIKKVGTLAREKIENFLQEKVCIVKSQELLSVFGKNLPHLSLSRLIHSQVFLEINGTLYLAGRKYISNKVRS